MTQTYTKISGSLVKPVTKLNKTGLDLKMNKQK